MNPSSPTAGVAVDYLIVGGGTAGTVLANRLSENPSVQVVLVEAGGEARSPLVQLPVGFAKLVAHPVFDWRYPQAPDPTIHGRHFVWSAGRLLGGSSSINGQVYIRGTRRDFDRWAEAGARGWNFDAVLPYFKRSEDWTGAPHPAHGQGGPLTVSPMRDVHPLCRNFLEACAQSGLPTLADYHGGDMEGAFLTVGTQRDGWRCSAEKAFLRPARQRPNLRVITNARVERVVFDGRRAVGIHYLQDGRPQALRAQREVIVSAGTVGSAALLLRSGVGPGAWLQSRGIGVVHDLEGVGQNLQEHASVGQNKFVNVPTLNSQTGLLDMLGHAWRFANGRKGILSAPAVQAMGLARTSPELAEPDVQLHFMPLSYDILPETVSTASATMPKEPTITINVTLCQPKSRGRVELDADGQPLVMHQFLSDSRDVDSLIAGQKLIDRLFGAPALRSLIVAPRSPEKLPQDDADWADYVRWKTAPAYHPVGTCRMGRDAAAVVDPALRVHGIEGLRVIDASVMPTVTSGNTNAPTMMIAEKGADLIRGRE
ncbi:MAG TPA: GMC family oxidoreductase N-terminal domain-containing protein [Solimonas sp.]